MAKSNHIKIIKTRIRGKNNEWGFSILEVLIAVSILSVGLLAVATMQTSSIMGNSFASKVTSGTSWAGDQVEKLTTLAYSDPDLSSGNHVVASPAEGYSIEYNVTNNVPISGTKTIDVTVTWTDRGAQKTVTISSVIPEIK